MYTNVSLKQTKNYLTLLKLSTTHTEEEEKYFSGRQKKIWVADRENEIYFTFVGREWDEDRTPQYDLIWKGKKILVYYTYGVDSMPLENNPTHKLVVCTIVKIHAPKEFRQCEEEMIELIKSVIAFDRNHEFFCNKLYEKKNTIEFEKIATPKYFDEVI